MIDKTISRTRVIGAATLTATVSPCSWMYPGYGLQIQIQLAPNGGTAYLISKGKSFTEATEADIDAMLESVKLVQCSRCGSLAFDPETVSTNRAGKCETCFIGDLDKELDAARKKDAEKLKRTNARMKAKGMTHRVDAWVHPAGGGDDYLVSLYVNGAPTKSLIQKELKKLKSSILDDYTIQAL